MQSNKFNIFLINFGQIYCIIKENELKYIIEKECIEIFTISALLTRQKIFYINGGFLPCQ